MVEAPQQPNPNEPQKHSVPGLNTAGSTGPNETPAASNAQPLVSPAAPGTSPSTLAPQVTPQVESSPFGDQPVMPKVAPTSPAAPAAVAAGPATPGTPAPTPKTPEQLLAEKKALKEQKKKKKLLFVLLGTVIFVFFIVFLVVFFMLSQSGGTNPLLQLFGLTEEQLYPFLINLANIFFGIFVFVSFLISVIGAFMTAMAKKEDKPAKKKGLSMLIVGLLFFMVFSVTWAGSYFYLKQKKDQYTAATQETTQNIVTTPEDTTNLTAPAVIEFDASRLPVDTRRYTIISYAWDFGDESKATGPIVSHRYTSKGENNGRYIVQLTVAYRDNSTSEEAQEVFTVDVVFVNEKVNAFFTATPTSGPIPLTVHFDASESIDPDGEIVAYEWDFDNDGSYDDAEGIEADYTFEKYGTYTVKLRVTDNNRESAVMEMEIVAEQSAQPSGTIEVTKEKGEVLYVQESYRFDVSEASSPNGSIEKYEWDFGDGSGITKNKSAEHTYAEPGTYTVTLTLTDEEKEQGSVTEELKVVIPESKPVAVISTNKEWSTEEEDQIAGQVPFTVEFSGESSYDSDENIVDYQWDIDDDGTLDGTGVEFKYTYEEAGEYTATLHVQDAEGNESEASILVQVQEQGLSAQLSADTLNGQAPLTVSFDASGSSYPSGEIVNYFWDFGNEVTRYDDARVTYTFDEVGTFTVKVKAIASDGTESTDSIFINVIPVSISACFTVDVDSGEAPLEVNFNPSCSTGTVINYRWDFGDGDISYARKPTHTYEKAGTYKAILTVEDSDGVTDTYTISIAVQG